MKSKQHLFVATLLLINAGSVFATEPSAAYAVQQVEDGDTLLIDINGQSQRVQLLGIDAPENSENPKFMLDSEVTGLSKEQLLQLGVAATEYLQKLAPVGSDVTIKGDLNKKDKYGRLPAVVINAEGRPLPEAMVQDGYAIPLQQQAEDEEVYMRRLDRLERFSRKSQNGLWGNQSETMHNWYDRTR